VPAAGAQRNGENRSGPRGLFSARGAWRRGEPLRGAVEPSPRGDGSRSRRPVPRAQKGPGCAPGQGRKGPLLAGGGFSEKKVATHAHLGAKIAMIQKMAGLPAPWSNRPTPSGRCFRARGSAMGRWLDWEGCSGGRVRWPFRLQPWGPAGGRFFRTEGAMEQATREVRNGSPPRRLVVGPESHAALALLRERSEMARQEGCSVWDVAVKRVVLRRAGMTDEVLGRLFEAEL